MEAQRTRGKQPTGESQYLIDEAGSNCDGQNDMVVVPILRPETHPEVFIPVAPDSGWSWFVLLASALSNMIIDGISFSIGLLLIDISEHLITSKAKVSLIGSLFFGFYQIGGPFVAAMINRFGCRSVAVAGSLLAAFVFFISAFMSSVSSLLFTFGFCGGVSLGLIHLPSLIAVNFYFCRKRALANGIAVTGSPVGAVIFGPLISYLIQTYTWSGTLIILAGVLLHCAAFACLYRPLLPPLGVESLESACLVVQPGATTTTAAAGVPPDNLETTLTGTGFIHSTGTLFTHNSSVAIPLSLFEDSCGLFRSGALGLFSSTCPTDYRPLVAKEEEMNSGEVGGRTGWRRTVPPQPTGRGSSQSFIEPSQQTPNHIKSNAFPPSTEDKVDKQLIHVGAPISFTARAEKTEDERSGEPKQSRDLERSGEDGEKVTRFFNSKHIHEGIFSTPCLTVVSPNDGEVMGAPSDGGEQAVLLRPGPAHRFYRQRRGGRLPGPASRAISPRGQYLSSWSVIGGIRHPRTTPNLSILPPTVPTISEGKELLYQLSPLTRPPRHSECVTAANRGQAPLEFSSAVTLSHVGTGWERIQRTFGYLPSPTIHSEFASRQEAVNDRSSAVVAGVDHGSKYSTVARLVEFKSSGQPAIVLLPHRRVTMQDYRRPMYRKDIFYRGNAFQEQQPESFGDFLDAGHNHPQLVNSSMSRRTSEQRVQNLTRSAFTVAGLFSSPGIRPTLSTAVQPPLAALRVSSRSPKMSRNSPHLSVTDVGGAIVGDPVDNAWMGSYLASMTQIPLPPPDQLGEEKTSRSLYSPSQRGCYPCRRCATQKVRASPIRRSSKPVVVEAGPDDGSDQSAGSDTECMSLNDCCFTCLRRLRDRRMFIHAEKVDDVGWKSRKHVTKRQEKASRLGETNKWLQVEEKGDEEKPGDLETADRYSSIRPGYCYCCRCGRLSTKSFTDVLVEMTDCRLLHNREYLFALLANFLCALGLYVPVLFVSDLALHNGIPSSQSFYLIFAMGLANIPGRLVFAWCSSITQTSPLLLLTVTLLLVGCTIMVMPFCTTFVGQVLAFSFHGLLSGPFVSLSSVILCDLVGIDSLTNAVGLVTLIRGVSNVLGPPIIGLLFEATNSFKLPYIAAGAVNVMAALLFVYVYIRGKGEVVLVSDDVGEDVEEVDVLADQRNDEY